MVYSAFQCFLLYRPDLCPETDAQDFSCAKQIRPAQLSSEKYCGPYLHAFGIATTMIWVLWCGFFQFFLSKCGFCINYVVLHFVFKTSLLHLFCFQQVNMNSYFSSNNYKIGEQKKGKKKSIAYQAMLVLYFSTVRYNLFIWKRMCLRVWQFSSSMSDSTKWRSSECLLSLPLLSN